METITHTPVRTPAHLWLVGIIAVLFNSIGVFDFVMSKAQGPKYLAAAGMTPAQIAYYQDMPMWMTAVWAIGVFGAFLASVLLLMRRKLAFGIFVLSTSAFVISLLYTYVLSNGGALVGKQMATVNVVILALLLVFTWYAHAMGERAVLR